MQEIEEMARSIHTGNKEIELHTVAMRNAVQAVALHNINENL